MGALGWPHLLILLAVILLIFGAARLPALAKSLGQSARVFRGEMKAMKDDDAPTAERSAAERSAAESTVVESTAAPEVGTKPSTSDGADTKS